MNQRKALIGVLLIAAAGILVGCAGLTPAATPTPEPTPTAAPTATPEWARPGWTLVWQDEFDGPEINPAHWSYEYGGGGWGNSEWQYYTGDPTNSFIEDGQLVIQALEEDRGGRPYTSARIITRDKVEVTYGRIEARIQVPYGQGIWPAFWMLGADFMRKGWPDAGEIDIMEHIGREPTLVHGTVHGPGYAGGTEGLTASTDLGKPVADDFHVFAIEWEAEEIRWYVDDQLYHTVTPADLPAGTEWVYDHPFFLLLNLAVGGRWPGYPDDTTTFPQQMRVDYVRVYEKP
jgi:beta-glucanase (GH16 family)